MLARLIQDFGLQLSYVLWIGIAARIPETLIKLIIYPKCPPGAEWQSNSGLNPQLSIINRGPSTASDYLKAFLVNLSAQWEPREIFYHVIWLGIEIPLFFLTRVKSSKNSANFKNQIFENRKFCSNVSHFFSVLLSQHKNKDKIFTIAIHFTAAFFFRYKIDYRATVTKNAELAVVSDSYL